jgi:hypothetical protein
MAIALRRVLLRSNSSQCSLRSGSISSQLCSRRIHPTNTRCFHQSATRWKDDQEKDSTRRKSPSTAARSSARGKKSSISAPTILPADANGLDEGIMEEDVIDSVVQTGDLDATLNQLGINASEISPQEREELIGLVERVREVTLKDQSLDQLAEAMTENTEDLEGIEDAVKRLNINPRDLARVPTAEELEFLAESGVDLSDDNAIEEASFKAFAGLRPGEKFDLDDKLGLSGGEGQKPLFNIEDYQDDVEELPDIGLRQAPGFWNEDKHEDLGPDENFNQDDLPAAGHMELDLHREIREYARLIVWELPLLSSKRQTLRITTND